MRLLIAASVLSAILLVLPFPPYSLWPLVFVGLIPAVLAFTISRTWKQVFLVGAILSTVSSLLAYYWVGDVAVHFGGLPWIVGKLVLVLFSLVGETQFLIFFLCFFGIIRATGRTKAWKIPNGFLVFIFLPAFYLAIDYLYPKIFPSTLGHVLYAWFTVAQTAEIWGIYGLTLPILLSNLSLAALLIRLVPWLRSRVPEKHPLRHVSLSSSVSALLIAVFILVLSHFWGSSRIKEIEKFQTALTTPLKVSIVQANIGDVDKLASEQGSQAAVHTVLSTYKNRTLETVKRFKPDLVIWPETAYPLLYTHMQNADANLIHTANDQWVKDLLEKIKTPLFFGGYSMLGARDFNSAFLITPPYELSGLYQKSILMPYGEYVPLGPLADFVKTIIPVIADFGRGSGAMTFPFQYSGRDIFIGPQICYEGLIPEYSRDIVKKNADVIVNVTNDSWFGKSTEPWLHVLLTAFRSIEIRRPLIRATNTGFSLVLDYTGRVISRTGLFEETVLEVTLPVANTPELRKTSFLNTFYLRFGDWLPKLCALISLLFGFALVRILIRAKS